MALCSPRYAEFLDEFNYLMLFLTDNNQALNSAAGQGSSYSFVRRVTVGVVFLGTPFKGTAAHTKAQWLTTYSDFRGEKTSFALIKDLDRSTGVLDDIIQEFARSSKTKDYYLPIYCFFETIPTNLSKKVLPKPLAKYLRLDEFVCYRNHSK